MKNVKAVGPDDTLVDLWKCLRGRAVEFSPKLFNMISDSEKMSEEQRKSVLVPRRTIDCGNSSDNLGEATRRRFKYHDKIGPWGLE